MVKLNYTKRLVHQLIMNLLSPTFDAWGFVTVSRDDERAHEPEAEVEILEAGALGYHELESDFASQHGCYSPVSSVSDMEPPAEHGTST